jgi:hypothetical protein
MNEPVDETLHHHNVLAPQQQLSSKRRTKKLVVQHGMAIEPHQLTKMNAANDEQEQQQATEEADNTSSHLSELFITMCFFARLGFIQPPCCLHCAYHHASQATTTTADDSNNNNNNDATTTVSNISECYNLIPWRIDTSILLHPSQLTTPLPKTTTTSIKENNEEENNSDSESNSSSNIVFLTCTTAQCLVNGDSYPSLRWDSRNKQLLLF